MGRLRTSFKINSAASIKTLTGEGCAARIMERGWIMDY